MIRVALPLTLYIYTYNCTYICKLLALSQCFPLPKVQGILCICISKSKSVTDTYIRSLWHPFFRLSYSYFILTTYFFKGSARLETPTSTPPHSHPRTKQTCWAEELTHRRRRRRQQRHHATKSTTTRTFLEPWAQMSARNTCQILKLPRYVLPFKVGKWLIWLV